MTSISYNYSISNDFLNGIVDSSRLSLEIQESSITKALDYITTSQDECYIIFKEELVTADEVVLSSIVSLHTGQALAEPQEVKVVEELVKTGGHFQAIGRNLSTSGIGTHTMDLSWPIPVNLLSGEILTSEENINDILNCIVAPDTVIGVVSSGTTSGSNTIQVSSTVITNTEVGYYISIEGQDLGKVLSINTSNSTITVENELISDINTGAYVLQSVYFIDNFEVGASGRVTIGDTKVGGSYIPPNTVVRLSYTNITGEQKNLGIMMEYLY